MCARYLLALLIVSTALVACQPKAIPMTHEETQRVETFTATMSTRCVGRYLIDMPKRFVLNSESTTKIEGVAVTVKPMDKFLFDYALEAREIMLRRTHMAGKPDRPFLKRIELAPSIETGKVFNRAEKKGAAEFGRTLELQAWKDGYAIEMSLNATDGTGIPLDETVIGTAFENAERRAWSEYKDQNDTPEKLAHLLKIYERVSGRRDTEIPSTPGLCIPNGFVAGPDRNGQSTDAVYHLADAPDVWFGFGSSDAIKEDDSLLQRAPMVEQAMGKEGARLVRKGKRTVHGQEFEELLMGNTLQQDGVRGVNFMIYGNEMRTNPEQPYIDLVFYNGDRIPVPDLSMEEKDKRRLNETLTKATLSEAEALVIWDKVSATLRVRPGAF